VGCCYSKECATRLDRPTSTQSTPQHHTTSTIARASPAQAWPPQTSGSSAPPPAACRCRGMPAPSMTRWRCCGCCGCADCCSPPLPARGSSQPGGRAALHQPVLVGGCAGGWVGGWVELIGEGESSKTSAHPPPIIQTHPPTYPTIQPTHPP